MLAYLRSTTASSDTQILSFAWLLLCEFARRAGYQTPRLTRDFCDLETFLKKLISLGKLLHENFTVGRLDYGDEKLYTAWLPTRMIKSDYGIALDDLLRLRIFDVSPVLPSIRFLFLCLQELVMILYAHYFGPFQYSILDRLLLGSNLETLRAIQRVAQSVPVLFNDSAR